MVSPISSEAFDSLVSNYDPQDEILVSKMALLIEKYPYFQLPRFFYAKSFKDQNKNDLSIALNKLALYTADREVLIENIESTFKLAPKTEPSQEIKTISIKKTEIIKKKVPFTSLMDEKSEQIKVKIDKIQKENPAFHLEKIKKKAQKKSISKKTQDGTPKEDLKLSFIDWIEFTEHRKKQSIDALQFKQDEPLRDKLQIIDRFIETNPKIPPVSKTEIIPKDLNEDFNSKELMTETLAKVLVKQKKYKMAIKAYRILSLKYPEKNVFFAGQIQKINSLLQQ